MNLSTVTPPRRCSKWQGVTVPKYPEAAGANPRQPRVSQIANALAGTGPVVWRVWVKRVQLLNPARWAALQSAFQQGRSLYGLKYISDKLCRQCGTGERTAVFNRCAQCYSSVRFNSVRVHTHAQLHQREQARVQREAAALIPVIVAGCATSWIVMLDESGVRFWSASKTQRILRRIEPILHHHYMKHDERYRDLFLFAVENQPLPEWAQIMHQS